MDSRYKIRILKEWKKDFHDLVIYDNFDGSFELAALSSSSLSYWKSSSAGPQVVSEGSYRKDTLYLSKHTDALYLWAFNDKSGKIDSFDLSNNKSYQIELPRRFALNNITFYCSPRLRKTICLAQGSAGGYSQLYYCELGSRGNYGSWTNWGNYYVGKPVVVESDTTLWVFVTYGYYNDWQYLSYTWSQTANLDWGKWRSMSYIGNDYHINSIVGVNARKAAGGYGVIVTNAEGAHLIKPDGGYDDWPSITGKTIEHPFYRSSFTKTGGAANLNSVGFIYLKDGQLSMINSYLTWGYPYHEFLQDNVTAFSSTQLFEVNNTEEGYPLVFCKESSTYLAVIHEVHQDR